MQDIDSADMILGMKIFRIPNGISLSLSHSIEKMLHIFNFYNSKHISTPYYSSIALKKNTGETVSTEILSINKFTSLHFQQDYA